MRSLVIFYFASCYITVHFNSLQSYYLLAWRLYTNLSILYGLLSYAYYLPYIGYTNIAPIISIIRITYLTGLNKY